MKTIETERLILRGWTLDDLDDYHEFGKNPKVGPMVGWAPHESKAFSLNALKYLIENDDAWSIVLKENSKVIGYLRVFPDENHGKLYTKSISYAISPEYWNKGYMTEAVKRGIKYAFDEMNIDLMTVWHNPDNIQTKRVIEKCGFNYAATIEQGYKNYNGQIFDSVYYELLKSDYYNA